MIHALLTLQYLHWAMSLAYTLYTFLFCHCSRITMFIYVMALSYIIEKTYLFNLQFSASHTLSLSHMLQKLSKLLKWQIKSTHFALTVLNWSLLSSSASCNCAIFWLADLCEARNAASCLSILFNTSCIWRKIKSKVWPIVDSDKR